LLLLALLGTPLHQFFCEQDQAEDLRPLGDDIADDLAPLRFGVYRDVQGDPGGAGHQQEDAERVVDEKGPYGAQHFMGRLAALRGAQFVEIFGGKDGDDHAQPVRDGVAEEGAEMFGVVGDGIEEDPGGGDGDGGEA
jgi:hypothetical protein